MIPPQAYCVYVHNDHVQAFLDAGFKGDELLCIRGCLLMHTEKRPEKLPVAEPWKPSGDGQPLRENPDRPMNGRFPVKL